MMIFRYAKLTLNLFIVIMRKYKGGIMAVRRLDVVEVPDWIASKFEFTPEGHLKGRAAVTNIGVFSYRYGDGKVVKELRLPEEVFDKESMTSLSGTYPGPGGIPATTGISIISI